MLTKKDCYLPTRNSMAMPIEMSLEAVRQQELENADENIPSYALWTGLNEEERRKWEEFAQKFK